MTHAPRDDGVSSVVAAVLVFALITTAAAFWATVELPEWEADRERAHQDRALGTFSGLQSDLEALVATDARGPTGRSVDLAPSPIALVGNPGGSGSLDLVEGARFQAAFADGELHMQDGAFVGVPGEAVTASHGAIRDVRAHVAHVTTGGLAANDAATVRWTWTDGTDSLQVDVVHAGSNGGVQCGGEELRLEWSGPAGSGRHVLLCGADALSDHRVDLMTAEVRAALGSLQRPLSVSGTTFTVGMGTTVSAVQGMAWTDGEGRPHASGGQATPAGMDRPGSLLRYRPQYQHHPQEDLVWAHGAVVAAQEQRAGIARAPGFDIRTAGDQGYLDWTVVVLAGTDGVEGQGDALVSVTRTATSERLVTTRDATITLEGQGAAWRSFLESELELHGVTDAVVGGTGDTAELTLTTGIVTDWTVRLRVIDASIALS